ARVASVGVILAWGWMGGAAGEHDREVGKTGVEIDETEARHGASDEIVRQQLAQRRPGHREVIPLPEARPRQDEEQQTDLEEERYVEKATGQLPSRSTLLRRRCRAVVEHQAQIQFHAVAVAVALGAHGRRRCRRIQIAEDAVEIDGVRAQLELVGLEWVAL